MRQWNSTLANCRVTQAQPPVNVATMHRHPTQQHKKSTGFHKGDGVIGRTSPQGRKFALDVAKLPILQEHYALLME